MYLLTIMYAPSSFPEAISWQNISDKKVEKALTNFFTTAGLTKVVQLNQGSNFMSRLFQQMVKQLGIISVKVTAYYPQ